MKEYQDGLKKDFSVENQNPEKIKYYEKREEQINSLKIQLEWIKRQLEYAQFSQEHRLKMEVHRGEIYEFDWGVNVNAELSNRHYGLVLKDSSQYDPIVLVCPLKSNKRGAHPASDIDLGMIEGLGTTHGTLAVINQVRAMDKLRIFSKNAIGDENTFEDKRVVLSEDKMNRVLTALYIFLFDGAF